ncbi:MAG: hypothetical protein ACRDJ4_12210 [Actinomycetota bacterium]
MIEVMARERTGVGAGLGLWIAAVAVVGIAGVLLTAVAWGDLVPDDRTRARGPRSLASSTPPSAC